MSNENSEINGYKLSRQWFDFCFENPEKIRPIHTAIYMFALEHWNRLGQKKKFGFPSQMTMDAIGIKSYNTYIPAFRDLVDWGFFELIEKSQNQYSSNIIALSNINKASNKSLDKAFINHLQSTSQTKCSIDKQGNKEQGNKEPSSQKIVDVISDIEKIDDKNTLLALHIWNDVNDLRPNNKTTLNAKVENWSEPIRLMVEQDNRTHKEIWKLWQKVHKDSFWQKNVLSTAKLRDKFDQLAIKFQSNGKDHGKFVDGLFSQRRDSQQP